MISFRLRTKRQNCRGYVPCYERTPKIGWFDIHSVFATHVETACLLTRKATVHEMKLAPGPFAMIKNGDKTIELRLLDEKRQKIKIGDSIVFTETVTGEKLSTKVEKLHRFASFEELYKSLPLLKCGYTEETIPYAKPSDMAEYYSAEKQNQYGVVGIEISRPKQITDEAIVQLDKKAENQGL